MAKDYRYQRKAYEFLLNKFKTQELFSKEEFQAATGWCNSSFRTYFTKQFKNLLIYKSKEQKYRVSESFRRFITWENFQDLVTQNRKVASDYKVLTFDNVIIFEFFMPLTNESFLRNTLDALFYKDSVLSRLKTMDQKTLEQFFLKNNGESTEEYYDRICDWISQKFGGYSISHVNGRFMADNLKTYKQVYDIMNNGGKYLVDETTAIVRFIFPCGEPTDKGTISSDNYFESLALLSNSDKAEKEAEKIRLLFFTLFVQSIVMIVNGEDEIWMLESGMKNRLHIWRVNK